MQRTRWSRLLVGAASLLVVSVLTATPSAVAGLDGDVVLNQTNEEDTVTSIVNYCQSSCNPVGLFLYGDTALRANGKAVGVDVTANGTGVSVNGDVAGVDATSEQIALAGSSSGFANNAIKNRARGFDGVF